MAAVIFAFWLAALINMSFDVYLEGPQGGIPFWSAIGVGMVIMRASRQAFDSVASESESHRTAMRLDAI